MKNTNQIQKLREVIYSCLDPIVNSDYFLLDFPNHRNIGDSLIWAGELAYLRRLPFKCLYSCADTFFDSKKIKSKHLILLNGGGNFGDLWRHHQEFRLKIIEKYKENRIIIFPQSVYYEDENFIEKDAKILNAHPNLTICARDKKSYNLLLQYIPNATILFVPDMAFCLNIESKPTSTGTKKALFLKRNDKELANEAALDKFFDVPLVETHDWPTLEVNFKTLWYKIESRVAEILFILPITRRLIDNKTGLKRDFSNRNIQCGIDFINAYEEVYTTRLHGLILSILMGKKVYLFDNIYGKNSNFYNAWLNEFEDVVLIK